MAAARRKPSRMADTKDDKEGKGKGKSSKSNGPAKNWCHQFLQPGGCKYETCKYLRLTEEAMAELKQEFKGKQKE